MNDMSKFYLASALASFIVVIGCGEATKPPSVAAGNQEQISMKPDRVAVTRVGMTALGELSHIERAIKPFIGVKTAPVEVAEIEPTGKCRKTMTTNAAQWETRWRCGLDSTERGRKEIEGVERLNYEQGTRSLVYSAKFETRNFDDKESRENAHTLVTGRKIRVTFAAGSSSTTGLAKVRIASSAGIKNLDRAREGSNWSSSVVGTIQRSGDVWTMDKGAVIDFKGALYGLDGERKTMFASGDFHLVSETNIALEGLGLTDCTKPTGTWQVTAVGGGAKFNTALASDSKSVFESSGGAMIWPGDLCTLP